MGTHHPKNFTGIEVARGIAACLVVFYHAARHVAQDAGSLPLGSIWRFGHSGVDFFFVLSGFIILFVHQADIGLPGHSAQYIKRRLTRIFPLYWLALVAGVAALVLSPNKDVPGFLKILEDVFLLPAKEPTLGVAWTLQHEMLFYALFLTLIVNRMAGLVLFGLWGALLAAGFFGLGQWNSQALTTLSSEYNIQFFIGMAAALVLRRRRIPAPRLVLAGGAGAFLFFGALENCGVMDGHAAPARVAYGLSAMIVVLGLVESERQGMLKAAGPMIAVGNASYFIYLLHLLIIGVLWKLLVMSGGKASLPPDISCLMIAAAAVGLGVLGSRLIEKPLMALLRRVIDGEHGLYPSRLSAARS